MQIFIMRQRYDYWYDKIVTIVFMQCDSYLFLERKLSYLITHLVVETESKQKMKKWKEKGKKINDKSILDQFLKIGKSEEVRE